MSRRARTGIGSTPEFDVRVARSDDDFQVAARLFREYQEYIDADLCFQDFEAELEQLARMYGPPGGCLLLARAHDGKPVGCVGVRGNDDRVCEMKRLYVREAARGTGLGRRLAEAILAQAGELGYRTMRLDTLPKMRAAQALYRSLGFRETEPYYGNPIEGTVYMQAELAAAGGEPE